jgi:hypothetical protein
VLNLRTPVLTRANIQLGSNHSHSILTLLPTKPIWMTISDPDRFTPYSVVFGAAVLKFSYVL